MFNIIIFLIPFSLIAKLENVSNGFGLDIGSSGSGVFFVRQYSNNDRAFAYNFEARFYDIKAENETIVYDYYSRQYQSVGGKSLFMSPIFLGFNYYPFREKIENSFSPFIAARYGLVFILDGKDYGSFLDRWSEPTFEQSTGGFVGLGIDFKYIRKSFISTIFGYEYLPPDPVLSSNEDLESSLNSGILIHISFNRYLE